MSNDKDLIGSLSAVAHGTAARAIHTYKIPKKLHIHGITSIGLVELTPGEESMALKLVGTEYSRIGQEYPKMALRAVNGNPVGVADGSVDAAYAKMPPPIRGLLSKAYAALHNPTDEDTESFLESHEVSVG